MSTSTFCMFTHTMESPERFAGEDARAECLLRNSIACWSEMARKPLRGHIMSSRIVCHVTFEFVLRHCIKVQWAFEFVLRHCIKPTEWSICSRTVSMPVTKDSAYQLPPCFAALTDWKDSQHWDRPGTRGKDPTNRVDCNNHRTSCKKRVRSS